MFAAIALVVIALAAAGIAIYYFAPGVALAAMTRLGRRTSGLALRQIEIDGHRMPYLIGGSGEPLILLHGFGANKDHWTMIARFLTPHFRVIVPDLPGFGDASRRLEAVYGVEQQLARIGAFVAALGIDHCHLGGNSMGAYLAALFAARQPQRVRSLWLLAPAGVVSAAPSATMDLLAAGDNPLVVTDAAGFERLTRLCFTVVPYMPAQFKRPLLARALADAPFNAKIFGEMFSPLVELESEVRDLATPTLLVWGDDDQILHPSGLAILRPLLRQVECRLMQRMGHAPMLERPAETAADFLRFHRRAA